MFNFHFDYGSEWILICNPSCIDRIHENIMMGKLMSTSSCNHIQRSFGHICMRMKVSFSLSVENTLHTGDIYDK